MPNFEEIKKEYNDIIIELSNPDIISNWERFEELSKKKKKVEEILEKLKEIEEIEKRIEENELIILSEEEKELITLAQTENSQLKIKKELTEKEIAKSISTENDSSSNYNSIIIEIRAGAGGDEAALFAGDLFRMYSKFASNQKWNQKVLVSHPTELGGFKEIIFQLNGPGIYDKMKQEGGVHRVQRIPSTEKTGRVHTSTATVAVLPKPKEKEIKIRSDELKIESCKSSGPGGQNVNKRETAVRVTHIPTGLSVFSQTEKSQAQNKESALSILYARLLEKQKQEAEEKIGGKRTAQIGSGKRAEKIRTYNFPQNRLTDHRIKKTWHNLEEIIEGKIEKIIKPFSQK